MGGRNTAERLTTPRFVCELCGEPWDSAAVAAMCCDAAAYGDED